MLSLNEDCFNLVFDQLDVYSHIALSSTCTKLCAMIKNYYCNRTVQFDQQFWNYSRDHQQMVAQFSTLIGPHIKAVLVECALVEDLQVLHKSFLEKITTLKMSKEQTDGPEMNPENLKLSVDRMMREVSFPSSASSTTDSPTPSDVKTFPNITFPNLTKLKLSWYDMSNFKAENFPKLMDLSLKDCMANDVDFRNFENLTKLRLNDNFLSGFHLQSFMFLQPKKKSNYFASLHLTHLSLSWVQGIYSTFIDDIAKCQTLEELQINFVTENIPLESLVKLPKLRKIICSFQIYERLPKFCYRKGFKWTTIVLTESQLKVFKNKTKRLDEIRTLHFDYAGNELNERLAEELQIFLMKCKNLEFFTTFESFRLHDLMKVISKSFGERTKPLYVYTLKGFEETWNVSFPTFVKPMPKKLLGGDREELPNNCIICQWTRN